MPSRVKHWIEKYDEAVAENKKLVIDNGVLRRKLMLTTLFAFSVIVYSIIETIVNFI